MLLEDLGFNKFHTKETPDSNYAVDSQVADTLNIFPDNSLKSDTIENLVIGKLRAGSLKVDDYMQSTGFVTGTTGWQIKGDGTAEFVGITLSGGTLKYGKTSFTDSTNAGYILDSNGVYIGAASDTTYLKYTLGTGAFVLTGTVNANAGKFGTATDYWSIGATGLTAVSAGTDVIINYGKTDFTNTQTGFILGYDYSASLPKFYIGTSTHYLNFDGTDLTTCAGIFNAGTMINALVLGDGTSNSGRLTLNIADTHGDCYINAGKTDFTNVDAGFIMGIDDSDSNLSKIYIGNSTNYLNWDGAKLTIAGDIINIDTSTDVIIGTIIPVYKGTSGELLSANDAVYMNTDGKIHRADSKVVADCNQFIGFSLENVAKSASVKVQLNGFYRSFTGLTIGSAYYLQDIILIDNSTESGSGAGSSYGGTHAHGQTFKTTSIQTNLGKVSLPLRKHLNPTGNFAVELRTTSGGLPTATILASVTKAASDLTTSFVWYDFIFDYKGLTASTTYAITITYSGGDVNNWVQGETSSGAYADGARVTTTDEITWVVAQAYDMSFKIYDMAGRIGTSAGSTSKKVGIALEATKLLMLNS